MPVVIFFTRLDLEQKFSFMDGHQLEYHIKEQVVILLYLRYGIK